MQKTNTNQKPSDENDPLNARLAEDQENGDDVNDVDNDADLTGDEKEESDDTPELDEEDLEENDLSDDEADNVKWDPPTGNS